MKILIAPDKFKGSLTARQAGDAMREGVLRVWPEADVSVVPVADGGDGTAQAILDAAGGRRVDRRVSGPNGKPVDAWFAILLEGRTAVVELATASGLALLPPGTNDPLTATTYGTGELIAAALDAGQRRIILAIGGSATNDAGAGALTALGAHFLDTEGVELPPGGAALARVARIEDGALRRRLTDVRIDIACDVDNPLVGPNGASAVYGPQKGASPDEVRQLDAALTQFARVAQAASGASIADVPGAGAAGGIAGGFLALAGARLVPGAQLVFDTIGFERRLDGVSLVITGEGRLDRQTLAGKAPYAVAQAARRRKIPALAVAGSVALNRNELDTFGLESAEAIAPPSMPLDEAMKRAAELTADAAERAARGFEAR